MKQLHIEWQHYEKAGQTCLRCSATGKTLENVISDLREELAPQGIEVTFVETNLPVEELAQSNMVLFNGVPLEGLLGGLKSPKAPAIPVPALPVPMLSAVRLNMRGRPTRKYPKR